jgi:SAM-dependent methyltransferase
VIKELFEKVRARSWKIYEKYYGAHTAYRSHNARFRDEVSRYLKPDAVLLDAGAGSAMPFASEFGSRVRMAIGVDLGKLKAIKGGPWGVQADLARLPFKDETVDIVISMSVVEHLENPPGVFGELARVLKPKGVVVLQTPNKYDYVSLIAHVTPFRFHQWLLSNFLDRRVEDIFPTCFRANTRTELRACLSENGLAPMAITLFNQYPAYLMFWPLLFRLGILYERLTSRYEALSQLRGWLLAVAEKK